MKKILAVSTIFAIIIILTGAVTASAQHQKRMKDRKTIGLILNRNSPEDTLDKNYNSDYGTGLKIGYGLTDEIGLEFALTSFTFDGKSTVGSLDSLTIENLRLNAFYRFVTATNLYPFATAGLGYYMIERGPDDLGVNFGLGLITDLIDFNEMWSLDLSWNYHRIFNTGKDAVFHEIRLGLSFNFY